MSDDLRNSLYLWAGGIGFALVFWALMHFDVFAGIPPKYVQGFLLVAVVVNLIQSIYFFRKRQRANKKALIDG